MKPELRCKILADSRISLHWEETKEETYLVGIVYFDEEKLCKKLIHQTKETKYTISVQKGQSIDFIWDVTLEIDMFPGKSYLLYLTNEDSKEAERVVVESDYIYLKKGTKKGPEMCLSQAL